MMMIISKSELFVNKVVVIHYIHVHMKIILRERQQLMTYARQIPVTDLDPVHLKSEVLPLANIIQPFSFNCQQEMIKLWSHSMSDKINCIKNVKNSLPVNECNNANESETMPIVHTCNKVLCCHGNSWNRAKTTDQYSCTWQKQTFSELLLPVYKKNRWNHFQNKYQWV